MPLGSVPARAPLPLGELRRTGRRGADSAEREAEALSAVAPTVVRVDRDPGVFELLRQQLDAMHERQRAGGGLADPSFWQEAAQSPPVLPGPVVASEVASGHGGARSRMRAPESRAPHRAAGPWVDVPVERLEAFSAVDLAQVTWADDAVMSDRGWLEATLRQSERLSQSRAWHSPAGALAPEAPAPVVVDAVVGMSLARHDAQQLTFAGEWVAQQRASHDVMLVNIVAELEARGVDAPDGLSRVDWLRAHDPSLTAAAARAVATVGAAFTQPRWDRLRVLVTTQQVPVSQAAQIVEFEQRVAPVADPADVADAVADLTAQARVLRGEELARLVRHHTEQVRPPRGDDDAAEQGRRQARGLWFGQPNTSGMVAMRGVLDPEAAAVLKSAVDPLSAPCPATDDHGHLLELDPRSPAKRRADALVEIVRRGVAAADGQPVTDKAKVVVLIDLDTLVDDGAPQTQSHHWSHGTGRGTGRTLSGDVLSAETVRRMACDAGIIPLVLGGEGEPLDVGREKRLVSKGLRLALAARDQGCSFPGCSIPAQWADAHHVVHWAHGGGTSLLNTALLCARHHTHVHRHDLTATVTRTTVTWHV